MVIIEARQKKEEEIKAIFSQIQATEDKDSLEYEKLIQKIYSPIWAWALLCFKEKDVRNAGLEIFHCVKRSISNYNEKEGNSYIALLYKYLETEIGHKKEKAEVKKFRMCTKNQYSRAVQLINMAKKLGKNPNNQKVQEWLAKQAGYTLEEVRDLVTKYYQSQIVKEQLQGNDDDDDEDKVLSVFETEAVHNNYLNPEESVINYFDNKDNTKKRLKVIEKTFENCQERQKVYLSSFITLRILHDMEKVFLPDLIIELLKNRNFLDKDLLESFVNQEELPTQAELAARFGKDEGYVSNRISDFFEKAKKASEIYEKIQEAMSTC